MFGCDVYRVYRGGNAQHFVRVGLAGVPDVDVRSRRAYLWRRIHNLRDAEIDGQGALTVSQTILSFGCERKILPRANPPSALPFGKTGLGSGNSCAPPAEMLEKTGEALGGAVPTP